MLRRLLCAPGAVLGSEKVAVWVQIAAGAGVRGSPQPRYRGGSQYRGVMCFIQAERDRFFDLDWMVRSQIWKVGTSIVKN